MESGMRNPGPALQIHGIIDKLELSQLATLAKKAQDGAKLSPRDLKLMADLRAKYPQAEKPKRKKRKTRRRPQNVIALSDEIQRTELERIKERQAAGARLSVVDWKILKEAKAEQQQVEVPAGEPRPENKKFDITIAARDLLPALFQDLKKGLMSSSSTERSECRAQLIALSKWEEIPRDLPKPKLVIARPQELKIVSIKTA